MTTTTYVIFSPSLPTVLTRVRGGRQIPFRRHIRAVFADTFEIYLRIKRTVDMRIKDALGWNTPDWRVKNACRACCYKVRKLSSTLYND